MPLPPRPRSRLQRCFDATVTAWHNYSRWVVTHPKTTATATGATLWFFGNLAVQVGSEKRQLIAFPSFKQETTTAVSKRVDRDRLHGNVFFGATVTGYMSHLYYHWLDRFMLRRGLVAGSRRFVVSKLAVELCMWQPFTLVAYFYLVGAFEGKRIDRLTQELRSGFTRGMAVEWSVWLPTQSLNFLLVPVRLQVLVVNLACVAEAILLSMLQAETTSEQQQDAV